MGAITAQAQTLFTDTSGTGEISDVGNWTNGLPAIGNQGTLTNDAARADLGPDWDGWDLVQTGGTLTDGADNKVNNQMYGGTVYEIQTGATYKRTKDPLYMSGGATIKVTGGSTDIKQITAFDTGGAGFTLEVSAGTFSTVNLIRWDKAGGDYNINVSGGTMSLGAGKSFVSSTRHDVPNIFYNVSGGSLLIGDLSFSGGSDDTNINVTISNDGTFITEQFNQSSALKTRTIATSTSPRRMEAPHGRGREPTKLGSSICGITVRCATTESAERMVQYLRITSLLRETPFPLTRLRRKPILIMVVVTASGRMQQTGPMGCRTPRRLPRSTVDIPQT
jgi:hypothetical protein